MDRFAANTLRTLGIILTALIVILASAWILLLSLCFGIITKASQSGPPPSSSDTLKFVTIITTFSAPAVLIIIGGLVLIALLSRGIISSFTAAAPGPPYSIVSDSQSSTAPYPVAPPESQPSPPSTPPILLDLPQVSLQAATRDSVPLRLSPHSRQLLDRLALAMIAQILVSPLAWIVTQFRFWTAPGSFLPHSFISVLLGPFILYHLPYAVLIYLLLRHPTRRALTYSLAVPAVILFQSLFTLGLVSHYYIHATLGVLLLFLPWTLHIVVLVLAYFAVRHTGLYPEPKRLLLAAAIAFIYFSVINGFTPLLYRFNWR